MRTGTERELLLIHANCQGEPLAEFLARLPGVGERYEVRLVTNYLKEPLPERLLARAGVFLYQHLHEGWGELASEAVLPRLPVSCRTLAFPSMFLGAYWPFWGHYPGFDYPDTLLDSLLDKGLPPVEVKRIYLRSGVVGAHDFGKMAEESLAREYRKEQFTPIKHVERMLRDHREQMVFTTANHPGHEMLCWLGRRVLEELGWPVPEAGVAAYMPALYPEFHLPVHPKVAEACGFGFAGEQTRFPVYGRNLTFEEYVDEYILAKVNGISEFIDYLRVRARQAESGQEQGEA